MKEIKVIEVKSLKKFYKLARKHHAEVTRWLLAVYGPEPVGWGGEELWELSFELPEIGVRYLCYDHRY